MMDNWYNKAMAAQKTNPNVAELMEAYKVATTPEDKEAVKNAIVALLGEDAPAKEEGGKEVDALEITAEVVTITSDSVETLHTVTMVMPQPADWSLNMVRSFFRRRLLPFYFREKNVTYKAIVKVLTDESMIKSVKHAFRYNNTDQSKWDQQDYQMYAIERGLYSFPLPNNKSLGELRAWLMNHDTDETATLQE